jgi:GNAT superfamily N-acetyltransferase
MIDVRLSASAEEDARSNGIYNVVCPRYAIADEDAAAFKAAMREAADHLAYVDGTLAGSAFTAVRGERPDVVFALITVLEPHRRQGVGRALFEVVSEWARARRIGVLESFVDEAEAASLAFATERGFEAVERFERLVLELTAVGDLAPTAAEDVQIVRWDGDEATARGAYAVALEAYRDEPDGEDNIVEPYEAWLAHDFARLATTAPTFVALVDGEVVGYSQLTMTRARPGEAAHAFTGVKRSWRGRGVATALKRTQIRWAKENGVERLATQNEERNAPMLKINERLGYRSIGARLLVRGPVSRDA